MKYWNFTSQAFLNRIFICLMAMYFFFLVFPSVLLDLARIYIF